MELSGGLVIGWSYYLVGVVIELSYLVGGVIGWSYLMGVVMGDRTVYW